MKEWYKKEKLRAENSDKNQVRLHMKIFKININQYKIDTIKRQIMNLKDIEKKIEKIPRNDIRRYFIV